MYSPYRKTIWVYMVDQSRYCQIYRFVFYMRLIFGYDLDGTIIKAQVTIVQVQDLGAYQYSTDLASGRFPEGGYASL